MSDSFATCQAPSACGSHQARILGQVAIFFSGSSEARDWTHVSSITGGFLPLSLGNLPYYSMYHPAILNESQDTSQCSPGNPWETLAEALSIDLATEKHMVSRQPPLPLRTCSRLSSLGATVSLRSWKSSHQLQGMLVWDWLGGQNGKWFLAARNSIYSGQWLGEVVSVVLERHEF